MGPSVERSLEAIRVAAAAGSRVRRCCRRSRALASVPLIPQHQAQAPAGHDVNRVLARLDLHRFQVGKLRRPLPGAVGQYGAHVVSFEVVQGPGLTPCPVLPAAESAHHRRSSLRQARALAPGNVG